MLESLRSIGVPRGGKRELGRCYKLAAVGEKGAIIKTSRGRGSPLSYQRLHRTSKKKIAVRKGSKA